MSVRSFIRPRKTTNFHEVGYLSIFLRYVKKMEVSLKSSKNNGYFTQSLITSVISRGGFTVKLMKFNVYF
jgi:maltodextrin utilization protein YvdJ